MTQDCAGASPPTSVSERHFDYVAGRSPTAQLYGAAPMPTAVVRPYCGRVNRRTLLVDTGLALVVGFLAWGSAAGAISFPGDEHGPWGRRGPGWFEERNEIFPDGAAAVAEMDLRLLIPGLLLVMLAVAIRRWRPWYAFAAVVLGTVLYLSAIPLYGPVLLGPVLVVFIMLVGFKPSRPGSESAPSNGATGWRLAVIGVGVLIMLTAGHWRDSALQTSTLIMQVFNGLTVIMVPVLFGLLRRNRLQTRATERTEELQRYVYEERLKIAREVHDVVGHSLSVIAMQAGVALHVLERRPDQASASLEAIRATSRDALNELRTTLDVFRDPDGVRAPQPGLGRLDELVAALRAAGRRVVLERVGFTAPDVDQHAGLDQQRDHDQLQLSGSVDQAAYRIVQEALTNVIRHTDAATATVRLVLTPEKLIIDVSDDGPVVPALGEGHGISGMRERARAVSGELAVETLATGGVRVRAELPLQTKGE